MVARAGGKYFVNLKGKSGSNVSTEISERQAIKLLTELEIKLKDYDGEPANKDRRKLGDDHDTKVRDIR